MGTGVGVGSGVGVGTAVGAGADDGAAVGTGAGVGASGAGAEPHAQSRITDDMSNVSVIKRDLFIFRAAFPEFISSIVSQEHHVENGKLGQGFEYGHEKCLRVTEKCAFCGKKPQKYLPVLAGVCYNYLDLLCAYCALPLLVREKQGGITAFELNGVGRYGKRF